VKRLILLLLLCTVVALLVWGLSCTSEEKKPESKTDTTEGRGDTIIDTVDESKDTIPDTA
jgi:hypothetical protein